MSSTSSLGNSNIVLQFNLSRDIDAAARRPAAIARANRQLPQDMPFHPRTRRSTGGPAYSVHRAHLATSPVRPRRVRRDMIASGSPPSQEWRRSWSTAPRSTPYASSLTPRLAPRPCIDEVSNAVQAANVNLPPHPLRPTRLTPSRPRAARQAAAYRPLVVAYRNGKPVRLEELGSVYDSVENNKTAAWYVGQRSVMLAIQRQPGTNTVDVVRRQGASAHFESQLLQA